MLKASDCAVYETLGIQGKASSGTEVYVSPTSAASALLNEYIPRILIMFSLQGCVKA